MAIYQGNKKLAYSCNVDNSVYAVPIGTILSYSATTPPVGFLVCDGSEVSKTTYSYLFEVIGDTYGTATDTSKFKLPDLRDKFVQGANDNLGTTKDAGLPNITGKFYHDTNVINNTLEGAFSYTSGSSLNLANSATATSGYVTLDASKSNPIYGNSDTVQPPSVCLTFIIKALKVSDKYSDTPKDIYSTDEVVTDKVWIDGKPIYRKVVTQTITTSSSENIISGFDISLIDNIISFYGSIKQPSGTITPISYSASEEDGAFICMSRARNSFVLYTKAYGAGDVILIVEYTKTTD